MTGTRLTAIVDAVRKRAAVRRVTNPFERLEEHVKVDSWRRERFLLALSKPELAFICEMKRRSPSAGWLFSEPDDPYLYGASRMPRIGPRWHTLADSYRLGGASALSIATEEDHFSGCLDDLRAAEFTGITRLRNDFVLDESMVLESCLYGADAVLLIAAIHTAESLQRVRAFCQEYGVAVQVEVRDEAELERAIALAPEAIGVNARDWKTLQVDLAVVERLLPSIPKGPIQVAQSGIQNLDDLKRVRAAGAQAVQVGESLIRSSDPTALLHSWKEGLRGH